MQVTLNIDNLNDWKVLLPLIERLGISFQSNTKTTKQSKTKDLNHHLSVIAKGGDATYFGDAAAWQKEQRQDRELPFVSNTL